MEIAAINNGQQKEMYVRPLVNEKMDIISVQPMEKASERVEENQLGKVILKHVKQLPKAFEEVATAVELAAKEKYMDRRNVTQRTYGVRGKFMDVTV